MFCCGSSQPRDWTWVSHTVGRFSTCATMEAPMYILLHWKTKDQVWYLEFLLLFSHLVGPDSLQSHGLQQARLPCPSLSPRVCSNSCPLSRWCLPIISSSVIPFSSCPESCPASASFPMNKLFISGGQSIGVSASVLPTNIQGWFPLGLTGLISLMSKGLSKVFSNTTVQKCQFFGAQLSLYSNSPYMTTGKP